jgi:hypothetical protein
MTIEIMTTGVMITGTMIIKGMTTMIEIVIMIIIGETIINLNLIRTVISITMLKM